jgi:hypothetical protein
MRRVIFLIVVMLVSKNTAYSQEKNYYFYHGRNYGSEGIFNPIVRILNSGYFTLEADNRSNRPFEIRYKTGAINVIKNLANPVKSINEYGWKKFLTTEIIPTNFKLETQALQWIPNYFGHLLGGGMTFRMTKEWFRFHGYNHPKLYAIATSTVSSFLNETVENSRYTGKNIDPIADLLIFDPLSILLFSSESVARLFSQKLNMAYWPSQTAYDAISGTLENNGHSFIFKYPVPFQKRVNLFFNYGIHVMSGFSVEISEGTYVSLSIGHVVKHLVTTNEPVKPRSLTATFVRAAGFYLDSDNSLLMSLILSPEKEYQARLNVYPGVLFLDKRSPGFFYAIGKHNAFMFGIHIRNIPIGLAGRLTG